MKLLRIMVVAALTAFGVIVGGGGVHATPATGVLSGAPAVKGLQTRLGAAPVEKAYYYYRRHYWHPYYRRYYWHRRYYRPYWHRRYWHRRYWHRRYYW